MTLTSVQPTPLLDGPALTPLRVALLGCGVVGSEVARLITGQAEDLRARVGRPLELVGIAVREHDGLPAASEDVDVMLFEDGHVRNLPNRHILTSTKSTTAIDRIS